MAGEMCRQESESMIEENSVSDGIGITEHKGVQIELKDTTSAGSSNHSRGVKRLRKEEMKKTKNTKRRSANNKYKHDSMKVILEPTNEEIASFEASYYQQVGEHIVYKEGVNDNEERNRLCDALRAGLKVIAEHFGFGSLDYSDGQMLELQIVFDAVAPKVFNTESSKLHTYFKDALSLSINETKKEECEIYLNKIGSETRIISSPYRSSMEEMLQKSEFHLDIAQIHQLSDTPPPKKSSPVKFKKHDFVEILQTNEFAKIVYEWILKKYKPGADNVQYFNYYQGDTSQCKHQIVKMMCKDCAMKRISSGKPKKVCK